MTSTSQQLRRVPCFGRGFCVVLITRWVKNRVVVAGSGLSIFNFAVRENGSLIKLAISCCSLGLKVGANSKGDTLQKANRLMIRPATGLNSGLIPKELSDALGFCLGARRMGTRTPTTPRPPERADSEGKGGPRENGTNRRIFFTP